MEKRICTLENYHDVCPLHDAHDKLEESFYFLMMMTETYHIPDDFRFNLNAFLQALRSVTFMLQKEKSHISGFEEWYEKKQKEMEDNICLVNSSKTRRLIVHLKSLKAKSKMTVGLYRGHQIKLGFCYDNLHPFLDSHTIFNFVIPRIKELGFIDEEHSAIGEQLGIKREWFCEELGDSEILKTCYEAYCSICKIMSEAHSLFYDIEMIPQGFPDGFFDNIYIILESDLDPSLLKKWGWIN